MERLPNSERVQILKHQVELRINKERGVNKKSRAGRLNKIVVSTVDEVDDLGRGVFKKQTNWTKSKKLK